jgi:hypothetical protein
MSATESLQLGSWPTLKKLRYSWAITAVMFLLALFLTGSRAASWWPDSTALPWTLLSGNTLAYFLLNLWQNLSVNRSSYDRPLPTSLSWPQILRYFPIPGLAALAVSEIVVRVMLVLGIAAWPAATLAVCLVSVKQNPAFAILEQKAFILVCIALTFLGSGCFSIWSSEDTLIYNRIGETCAS